MEYRTDLYYLNMNSYPIVLNPWRTYKIVDSYVEATLVDGEERITRHHLVEEDPEGPRF